MAEFKVLLWSWKVPATLFHRMNKAHQNRWHVKVHKFSEFNVVQQYDDFNVLVVLYLINTFALALPSHNPKTSG